MQEVSFEEALESICEKDPRYAADAYMFLREALDYTQKGIRNRSRGCVRHVSGQELLKGIREYALAQFGPMALTVFEEWGIRTCEDFGEMVFNMVDIGLLAKTESDSRADFQGGYDFLDVFKRPFLPAGRQAVTAAEPKATEA